MKNPQTYEEREAEFIRELNKLTKKYRVRVGGCGCCGSPWLGEIKKPNGHYTYEGDHLSWNERS